MTDDRANIKVSREFYERHNARREEQGLTWEEYIDGQAPDGLDRVAELVENVPKRTADELEGRFR